MRIVVTGGSGVIGSYVMPRLRSAGHEVVCFSRSEPRFRDVEYVRGDIGSTEQVEKVVEGAEGIIHLAGIPGPYWTTPDHLTDVNVVGTIRLLDAAVKVGASIFVLASTGASTGFSFQQREVTPRYLPLDEDHPSEPHDPYGLSKLLCEEACARYTRAFGLSTISLRICFSWAIDRKGAELAMGSAGWAANLTVEELWSRYRSILDEPGAERPRPGPPKPKDLLWAFVSTIDVAESFRLAVESQGLGSEVFLVTGNETCSLTETAELVRRHYPDVPVRNPLTGHATLLSHGKAKRILGFVPQHSWRDSDFGEWFAATRIRSG